MLHAITRLAGRHAARVLLVALVAAVVAAVAGAPVSGLLQGGGFDDPISDSSVARAQLAAATGIDDRGVTALVTLGAPFGTPQATSRIESVVSVFSHDGDVGTVEAPLPGSSGTTPGSGIEHPELVSRDQTIVLVSAFWRRMSDAAESDAAQRVQNAFASTPYVQLGGYTLTQDALQQRTTDDLTHAEEVVFPILFVLLILVFRSLVAALLPLIVAGLSVVLTFLILRGINAEIPLSIFALNVTTGLGLGLAIDASLLIVSRFREEIDKDHDAREAMAITVRTAGRTVAFSAVTVAAAMASLLVFPQRFLYSMGIGGVLVALLAASASLLVLPSLLVLLGPRVDRLAWRPRKLTSSGTGFWYRVAHFVMQRPVVVALVTTAFLVVIASPFRQMTLTYVSVADLPAGTSIAVVAQTISADFPDASAFTPAVTSVTAGPEARSSVEALAEKFRTTPGVSGVAPAQYLSHNTWRITATIRGDLYSNQATSTIRAMRRVTSPLPFKIGGDTAIFVDLEDSLLQHIPTAFSIIGIAILAVLFAATGSVVLPIKAVLMNAATLLATFGALVAAFQWGWLAGPLNFSKQAGIGAPEPLLIATIAFGLSTDYGVFLLTRIKEMHDEGHDTRAAVALGLERTGRVVTAAGLLFCFAIGSFAASSVVFVKEVGIGAAAAVLVDATIVRALLVPALMAILGNWNWWAPRPLRVLHRALHLDDLDAGARHPGAGGQPLN